MPDEDRLRLRHTFNEAAGSYHQVRPDYPAELFENHRHRRTNHDHPRN